MSEPNFHTTKIFTDNLLAIKMKKTEILTKTSIYLGLPILELSKILMYKFWYNYIKPKYDENTKFC